MGFGAAVASVFHQYARFAGRARRSEYWWWTLFTLLVAVVTTVIDVAVLGGEPGDTGLITSLVSLALVIPTIAVTVRRLHDTGKSGWRYLWVFLPIIGSILLLIWCVQDSTPEVNRFGPSPKFSNGYGPGAPAGTW